MVHFSQKLVALLGTRRSLSLIPARTRITESRNGMSSFCQVSANPLCTFESWPWGGLISIYRTAETPLHKVFVPEVRVVLWWIVPDSLLVYAFCHAMVVLAWKVEFWTVYWYGRFDYVMIIDALLIVRDFAICRGWCRCVPVVVRHVSSAWLASVHV